MFEGKPPRPPEGAPSGTRTGDEGLRPLAWPELVGRLALARDLRATLRAADASGEASFDAGSARRIAAQGDGKHSVNLEDSTNGKATGGKPSAASAAVRGVGPRT